MPFTEGGCGVLTPGQRKALLEIADASIREGLERGRPLVPSAAEWEPPLSEPGASFVTLKIGGMLRGCIGSLEAYRPLVEDVARNAFAAAFEDPRFPPLSPAEYPSLRISVSVLTPREPLPFTDEADLLSRLRPGEDGLVIEQDGRRATFLPAVWEELPEPEQFLAHLKMKAGIYGPLDGSRGRAWRYSTESFGDDG
ncbi:MAG: AmmeMemoRadiSam system protein A [Gammaproteobacteria bacterium]|nr:MAG: AmmeMemoRadiSam system protein A [Gammaproteobacteria bacterium]